MVKFIPGRDSHFIGQPDRTFKMSYLDIFMTCELKFQPYGIMNDLTIDGNKSEIKAHDYTYF